MVIYLADAAQGLDGEDLAFLEEAGKGGFPLILAWNKCDREGATPLPGELPPGAAAAVAVSARRGTGLADLVASAAGLLLGGGTEGAERRPSLGSERQRRDVAAACEALAHAQSYNFV